MFNLRTEMPGKRKDADQSTSDSSTSKESAVIDEPSASKTESVAYSDTSMGGNESEFPEADEDENTSQSEAKRSKHSVHKPGISFCFQFQTKF